MADRFVIDTNVIINYFTSIFNEECKLSGKAKKIFEKSLASSDDIIVIIPSVVFIEIQKKWFTAEEFIRKFYYEVYSTIKNSSQIEIKPIEREVLENVLKISGELEKHDLHDKIILASAMMLECPLITSDSKIFKYVKRTKVIPSAFF